MLHHDASARSPRSRPRALAVVLTLAAVSAMVWNGDGARAAVATVPLATAGAYSVLGGSTVTNVDDSVLAASLGLWPGTSVVGFPPGRVDAPGTIEVTSAVARQAQSDLTAAYDNAAGRPLSATTAADVTGLQLPGGVYAGPSKGALLLTGSLVLDGEGDPSFVFIFQTGASLTTASGSTVTLVNGAQACNVFWQVGSPATLGTGSVFVGSILALTSITVNTGATVHGRALARNGQVALDDDVFTGPGCASLPTTTSTPTTAGPATPTTATPPPTTALPTVLVPDPTPTTVRGTVLVESGPGTPTARTGRDGTSGPGAGAPGDRTTSDRTTRETAADTPRSPSSSIPDTGSDLRFLSVGLGLLALGLAAAGTRLVALPGRRRT